MVLLCLDEVHLRNGTKLRGAVREDGSRVTVQMDIGSVTLDRAQVLKVVKERSPIEEHAERFRAIRPGDAEAWFRLGAWARENDLPTKAREAFEKAVAVDPDHAGARRQLGYRRHQGRWMTEEEHMAALGFVRHGGEWLRRETVEKIHEQESLLQREREQLATLEKLKALEAELERMRIAASIEREKIVAESQKPATVVRYVTLGSPHYHVVGGVACPCWCGKKKK